MRLFAFAGFIKKICLAVRWLDDTEYGGAFEGQKLLNPLEALLLQINLLIARSSLREERGWVR